MKAFGVLIGVIVLGICGSVRADNNPPKPAATQPATTQPAVAVNLADRKALNAHVGSEVIVEGTVASAAWSASGKVFLIKFVEGEDSEFQGALFTKLRPDMEKTFAGDLTAAFEGAKIRIDGKLQIYREHPEILINEPKQITIIAKGPGNAARADEAKQ